MYTVMADVVIYLYPSRIESDDAYVEPASTLEFFISVDITSDATRVQRTYCRAKKYFSFWKGQ